MFLQLNHKKLDAYKYPRELALECYKATKLFPADERFNLIQQIRHAVISVHLNLAEGSSRKSLTERKRYYEIARGSIIEIDAAFDIAFQLSYFELDTVKTLGEIVVKSFRILTGLINSGEAA